MSQSTLSVYQTTIINPTASEQFYSFVPPFGRRVAAGAEITVDGDPHDWLVRYGARRRNKLAKSFQSHLENETIDIKASPAPVFYDATAGESKTIDVDNGTLRIVDINTNPTPEAPVVVGP